MRTNQRGGGPGGLAGVGGEQERPVVGPLVGVWGLCCSPSAPSLVLGWWWDRTLQRKDLDTHQRMGRVESEG